MTYRSPNADTYTKNNCFPSNLDMMCKTEKDILQHSKFNFYSNASKPTVYYSRQEFFHKTTIPCLRQKKTDQKQTAM